MPGLGLGLAGVTDAVAAVSSSALASYALGDYFWTLNLSHGGWALNPFAIGTSDLDDVPDNPFWDLKDIGDGNGKVHFMPESVATIGEPLEFALPVETYYWLVGRASGGDVTDTSYLRPIGLSDPR
tara:strand:- start:143 stop:520 length:378 start_codon:yes stop_codon:yes gene_type:complete